MNARTKGCSVNHGFDGSGRPFGHGTGALCKPQCRYTDRGGNRCSCAPRADDTFCFWHSTKTAAEVAAMGY